MHLKSYIVVGEDELINLVLSHASITTLGCPNMKGFQRIALGATQIQHLTVSLSLFLSARSSFKRPHFPELRSLTIEGYGFWDLGVYEYGLELEDFESFVCDRCLPVGHPRSRVPPNAPLLESLVIACPNNDKHWEHKWQEWKQGKLYDKAKVTIEYEVLETYGYPEEQIRLRWVS
jgi:hypothetical protein